MFSAQGGQEFTASMRRLCQRRVVNTPPHTDAKGLSLTDDSKVQGPSESGGRWSLWIGDGDRLGHLGRGELKRLQQRSVPVLEGLVWQPWMMIPTCCSVWIARRSAWALASCFTSNGSLQSIQSSAKFYVPSLVFQAQVMQQTILSILWSHQPLASSCKTWNCWDTKVGPQQTLSSSSSWLSSSAFCCKYIPPRTWLVTQVSRPLPPMNHQKTQVHTSLNVIIIRTQSSN